MKIFYPTIIVILAIGSGNAHGMQDAAAESEFFENRIRPVLVKHCYECHSTDSGKSKGGLRLDSRDAWQVGGDSGPAIVPGQPDNSPLLLAINGSGEMSEMPPKSRLPAKTVKDFRKWIADGAVDPREGSTQAVQHNSIDIAKGRKFWSFQPRRTFDHHHSIDDFVGPQASQASPDKLVRRLFLDLIGLPPTEEERTRFQRLCQSSSSQEAVATFTDELLARHEFGEKWARHWLDVARYADSNGGDFNLTHHQAWRYRNYVIDAFNEDMPYDQFVREQIAGDLLPFDDAAQRNRQLVATGFLMVAPKMLTERDKDKMHLDIADEQVDTIGRTIMGLTLGCARCHDHKFDPIPTSDYYAITGILHSTRTADRVLMNNVNVTGWTNTPLMMDADTQKRIDDLRERVKTVERKLEKKKAAANVAERASGLVVDDADAKRSGPWRKSTYRANRIGPHYLATDKDQGPYSITWEAKVPKLGKYEVRVTFCGGVGLAKNAPYVVRHANGETKLTVDQTVRPSIDGLWHPLGKFEFDEVAVVQLSDKDAQGHVIADAIQIVPVGKSKPNANSKLADLRTEIRVLETELKDLNQAIPETPVSMAAQDVVGDRMGDLHIRVRGEPKNRGPLEPRGFLQVASLAESKKPLIPAGQSGRVQLAEWLTHPDHPLTARVMVNRIWQQLFGKGIVLTSDNFGVRGGKPSHPKLLDYLAEEYIANGWSTKKLIREIICSQTYQQAAKVAAPNDPENRRLRHQNRRPAPAETIRDSMLAIAGELDRQPRNSVVEPLGMYAIATSGNRHPSLSKIGQLRQRSIYLPIVRGAIPPSLAVFDFPNPDLVTGKRSATNVPAQALFMMNSPFVREMSVAVGSRYSDSDLPLEQAVGQIYSQVLSRDADEDDIDMGTNYIKSLLTAGKSRSEAIASFVQILFSSTEFRLIE